MFRFQIAVCVVVTSDNSSRLSYCICVRSLSVLYPVIDVYIICNNHRMISTIQRASQFFPTQIRQILPVACVQWKAFLALNRVMKVISLLPLSEHPILLRGDQWNQWDCNLPHPNYQQALRKNPYHHAGMMRKKDCEECNLFVRRLITSLLCSCGSFFTLLANKPPSVYCIHPSFLFQIVVLRCSSLL